MGEEGGRLDIKRTRTSAQPGRRHLEHMRHLGWEDKIPLVAAGRQQEQLGVGFPGGRQAVCDRRRRAQTRGQKPVGSTYSAPGLHPLDT